MLTFDERVRLEQHREDEHADRIARDSAIRADAATQAVAGRLLKYAAIGVLLIVMVPIVGFFLLIGIALLIHWSNTGIW